MFKRSISPSPAPMSYSNSLRSSLSAEILEEDKVVEKYPMPVKTVRILDSDKTFRNTNKAAQSF